MFKVLDIISGEYIEWISIDSQNWYVGFQFNKEELQSMIEDYAEDVNRDITEFEIISVFDKN